MAAAGGGSKPCRLIFFMNTTLQVPPMAQLLSSQTVAMENIASALTELWQAQSNTAIRANTFSLLIYEPAPIQHLLTALGFYDGPIDGINGPLTQEALAKSQEAYGLKITGRANEVTFVKLEEAFLAASKQDIAPIAAAQNYRAADAIAKAGPCRIITLCALDSATGPLHAEISAYCPIQKQQQSRMLCCEYVTVTGSSLEMEHQGAIISDLLVPNLPQYLWWKGTPKADLALFQDLASRVQHVIIDSATFTDSAPDLQLVAGLVEKGLPIGDINWQRIAPWQELMAATFDPPDRRISVMEIDEVEINFERGSSAQAWLYLAWLAGRLGWEPISRQSPGGDYKLRQVFFKAAHGRPVKAELASMPLANVGEVVGDLTGIKLVSSNPTANCNTILCSETDGCMRMETGGKAQTGLVEQVNSLADQNAEQLVTNYFNRASQDWLYEETIVMLRKILALSEQ
jgi:glucose-6-phosphate dehydrogenase assembly protein OpcA